MVVHARSRLDVPNGARVDHAVHLQLGSGTLPTACHLSQLAQCSV
jgi:hypothetical protein